MHDRITLNPTSASVSDDQLNREASSRAGSRMSARSLSRRSGRSSALDYADLGQNEAQGLETGPQSSAADDEEHDMDEQFFEFSKETGKDFFLGGRGCLLVCLFVLSGVWTESDECDDSHRTMLTFHYQRQI